MKLSEQQLTTILQQYGYEFSRCKAIVSGYRNSSHLLEVSSGETYNFIVYKNEPGIVERIRRLNALSAYMAANDLPVRTVVDTRIVALKTLSVTRYGCLYSYCDGETIPWEAYTKKHIKLLGMALGKIHNAGRTFSGDLSSVTDEYRAIVQRMRHYFAQGAVKHALLEKLGLAVHEEYFDVFEVLLKDVSNLPDQLPLHMDLVRSNVLFREARAGDVFAIDGLALSGVLDFEKAAYGHPLVDVARTLAFLLIDCQKPAAKIYHYLLDSGYQKRGGRHLTPVKVTTGDMLEQLITLFLMYDFYKFIKQNPYESLPYNHHFTRTCGVLRHRKVIQYSHINEGE